MDTPNKRWRERNPDKVRAHSILNRALRSGHITRQPCESCGAVKVHAHHDDYSQPLTVRWLCQPCHERQHHTYAPRPQYQRKPVVRGTQYQPAPKRDASLALATQLRNAGASYRAIAAVVGATVGTVYKWLSNPSYD